MVSKTTRMSYLRFVIEAAWGAPHEGRYYSKLGRHLLAFTPKRMAAYVEAGKEVAERPARFPDFKQHVEDVYVEAGGGELGLVFCSPLFCVRRRYSLVAEGPPRDVYRLLAAKEGWPTEGERLEVEAVLRKKAPAAHPAYAAVLAMAAMTGRSAWTTTRYVLVVRGRACVVREVEKSWGRDFEAADADYAAVDGSLVYGVERLAYVLGEFQGFKWERGVLEEVDLAEVPRDALLAAAEKCMI